MKNRCPADSFHTCSCGTGPDTGNLFKVRNEGLIFKEAACGPSCGGDQYISITIF